jgi:hypothetical protein
LTGCEPSIVQYWHSTEIPVEVAELVGTFRNLNPDLHHRLFCEATAGEFIAEHFSAREVAAFRACAVPAMQADYFRYCAVLALGGIYSDADFRCVRPLRELLASTGGGRLFRREPPGYLLNGFFLFDAPGHPLLRLTLDIATANIEGRVGERVQMVTGPWIFSGLAALHRLGSSEPTYGGVGDRGLGTLVEPFHRMAAQQVPMPAARLDIPQMTAALFETVGDYGVVDEAFEGVVISPLETATEWVHEPESPLPYRGNEEHWINWQNRGSTIFR